jgi:hypothetical protein
MKNPLFGDEKMLLKIYKTNKDKTPALIMGGNFTFAVLDNRIYIESKLPLEQFDFPCVYCSENLGGTMAFAYCRWVEAEENEK